MPSKRSDLRPLQRGFWDLFDALVDASSYVHSNNTLRLDCEAATATIEGQYGSSGDDSVNAPSYLRAAAAAPTDPTIFTNVPLVSCP